MRPSKKQVGCCTLCGKEVFEIRGRWPHNHPLAGETRAVGRPLPTARCVTLLLMSGSLCTITLCSTCKPTCENLSKLWTICMEANAQELDKERRSELGLAEYGDPQHDLCVSSLRKMVVDLPIAVLSNVSWEETDDFSAHS